jgi:hypothetical protein
MTSQQLLKNMDVPAQKQDSSAIGHFFSSVAHVWVPGAKTTGPIVIKFVFS